MYFKIINLLEKQPVTIKDYFFGNGLYATNSSSINTFKCLRDEYQNL